jgi:hypothetical protein
VRSKCSAKAIITAHHQDDLIETAIINIIRGTKHQGFYALRTRDSIVRPLLHMTKQEILNYARVHNLEWREDSTNSETKYLRNRIRHAIDRDTLVATRTKVVELLEHIEKLGEEISEVADALVDYMGDFEIGRQKFASLPHIVAREVLAQYLRRRDVYFDEQTLERVTIGIKTRQNGKVIELPKSAKFIIEDNRARLQIAKGV